MNTSPEETVFVDPFLLTVTLVMTVLMVIGNLYFLANYSHHADSGFGSSAACKFVIVSKDFVSVHTIQLFQICLSLTPFLRIKDVVVPRCGGPDPDPSPRHREHAAGHEHRHVPVLADNIHDQPLHVRRCHTLFLFLLRDR